MSNRYYRRGLTVLLSMATLGIIIIALAYFSSSEIDTIWVNDVIIPLLLAFIAMVSVGIAVWQGFETRRHNRKSVKPALQVEFRTVSNESAAIVLQNKGVGPATITKLTYEVDGKSFTGDSLEDIRSCFKAAALSSGLMVQDIDPGTTKTELSGNEAKEKGTIDPAIVVVQNGTVYSSGEKVILLSFNPDDTPNAIIREQVRKIITRIAVVIHYTSIYDEPFFIREESNLA